MKKMINQPELFVDEFMEGISLAYGDHVGFLEGDKRILVRKKKGHKGKVGVVTAGGSGHLPVFLGYVGEGLLDGCAIGNVFASPSAVKMANMIMACDDGNGVLCLYGNYGGDDMNFKIACEMMEMEGIETTRIQVKDDVASSPDKARRRGIAGMVYAFKIAGAAAEQMPTLKQVAAVTEKALNNIRSMGVALSACVVPEVGKASFSIPDGKIGIGMGIHGEPGIEVCDMREADEIAAVLVDKIWHDMPLSEGNEVSVMVNGLGATPLEELFIVYRQVHRLLTERGVSIYMPHVGEFATSMEMAGLSLTIFRLDKDLKALLRSPAVSPFYTSGNR